MSCTEQPCPCHCGWDSPSSRHRLPTARGREARPRQGWKRAEGSFNLREHSFVSLHDPHQGLGCRVSFFKHIVISKIQWLAFPQFEEETAKIHPQVRNLHLYYFTDTVRSLQKAIARYTQSVMWLAMAWFSQKPSEAIIFEMLFLFRKILFCCRTKGWKYAPELAMNHAQQCMQVKH